MSKMNSLSKAHQKRTARVATQVRFFHDRNQPFRINHGNTNSTRRTKRDPSKMITTSDFSQILHIDTENQVAIVEPNVSMEELVDATLPLGFVPPVVMEFTAITVGGGFSGTSGESSSFRHGVFENTIQSIEIVLGDGEVVNASKTENEDLFHGAAGSFGTMGVVTLLEVRLVPARRFVELEYRAVGSAKGAVEVVEEYTADESTQYLDGIMFSKDSGVIMAGKMVDEAKPGLRISRYLSAWDDWFYIRTQEILETELSNKRKDVFHELVPMKDYLFRYDRGAFWGGKYCFKYFVTPFNRITRFILDDLLHTKVMYRALHKSGLANEFIVQDIGFPYTTTPDFIQYLDDEYGFYPIWLCPLRMQRPYPLMPKLGNFKDNPAETRVMNIGVWGPGPRERKAFIDANRKIEQKTTELGGLKCLYAHAYYAKTEFWDIYNKTEYESLRTKYKAENLPSVFEKVTSNDFAREEENWAERLKNVWPVRGLYGAVCVFWMGGLGVSRVHMVLSVLLSPVLVVIILGAWGLAAVQVMFGGKGQRKYGKLHAA